MGVIIGLAVGIPFGVLLLIIGIIAFQRMKKRNELTKYNERQMKAKEMENAVENPNFEQGRRKWIENEAIEKN